MKTSLLCRGAVFTVFGCFLIAGAAQAQDPNTYLYIAHAASGRTISSTTNPELPVDVSVNGICFVNGISYGEIRGPFSGPAGTYTFTVTTANAAFPCTGQTVYSAQTGLGAGTTYYGVITTSGGNVAALIFGADLNSVAPNQARVVVINATPGSLSAQLKGGGETDDIRALDGGSGGATLEIPSGSLQENDIPAGTFSGSIFDTASNTKLAGPITAEFTPRNSYLFVLGGSAADQSIQVIGPKVVGGVL